MTVMRQFVAMNLKLFHLQMEETELVRLFIEKTFLFISTSTGLKKWPIKSSIKTKIS